MKKPLSFSIVALMFVGLATISSCTKDPITVYYNIPTKQVCIPAKNNNSSSEKQEFAVSNSDVMTAFTQAGITYDEARIKSAEIKDLHVQVATSGVNFDQFVGLHVYVRRSSEAASENVKIADAGNLGTGTVDVTLNPYGVDLKEYLGDDLIFTLEVYSKNDGNPATCFDVTSGKFSITVKND